MPSALVCDVHPQVLYLVTFALTAIGWEVFTTNEGKNIFDKVIECSPSLILLDSDITEEGGVLTTQILKKLPASKDIPVILFSSTGNVAEMAEEAGTEFYLSKPFDIKKLQNMALLAYKCQQSDSSEEEMSA